MSLHQVARRLVVLGAAGVGCLFTSERKEQEQGEGKQVAVFNLCYVTHFTSHITHHTSHVTGTNGTENVSENAIVIVTGVWSRARRGAGMTETDSHILLLLLLLLHMPVRRFLLL